MDELFSRFRPVEKAKTNKIARELYKEVCANDPQFSLDQLVTLHDLTTRIHDMEQLYASLRNLWQLQESQDPWEVTGRFQMIKRRIINFCSGLSAMMAESLGNNFPKISSSTHAVHPGQLKSLLPTASGLYVSSSGHGRNIKDFVYYALLHALNTALKRDLFDRFHPHTSESEDVRMRSKYAVTRDNEVQATCGQWRSDAFRILDAFSNPEVLNGPWAKKFAQKFESGFIARLMTAICGSWDPSTISQEMREELVDIALSSYHWNRDTKVNFIHLDFHPTIFDDTTKFASESMTLSGQKSSSVPSGPIISSVGLGLFSTLSHGRKGIKSYWRMEVEVVMEDVF